MIAVQPRFLPLFVAALVLSRGHDGPAPGGREQIAFEGGIVHTMVPGEEPAVATILVADGRVVAVGPDLEVAPGTARHDLSGAHVVPMLIDGYVNFDAEHDVLYTAAGVGLVRDVGGNRMRLLRERDEERRARATGPSLITALALLDGDPPSTPEAVVLRDVEAAEKLLPILFEDQVDFLSVFLGLDPRVWRRVIDLAHEKELEVWGPVPSGTTIFEAIDAGQDGIHFLEALLPEGVIWDIVQMTAFDAPSRKLAETRTTIVPLLGPNGSRLVNQGTRPELALLFELLHPSYEVWWKNELMGRIQAMTEERLKTGQRVVEKQSQLVAKLDADGVPLLPGSGAPQPWLFPGQALHQELAFWVRAGLEPARVLHLATRGAAEILGVEAEHGSIQPGAVANFIVTDADPSADLLVLRQPRLLVSRGRPLEQADLEDLLTTVEGMQAGAREEINREIEVPAPPIPEGAVVVLDGVVESEAFGLRTSTEHFRVVRTPDDRLAYLGRVVYPREANAPERELQVSQVTQNGQLVAMEVALRNGDQALVHQGLWTAGRWRMQLSFGAQKLRTSSTLVRPVCADVGSVTTLLLLGQSPLGEAFPVLTFHEGLQPEEVTWAMELDDKGAHQVRTHLGRMAFRFDEKGAPAKALTVIGASAQQLELREADAFGGPGLALPADKRQRIEAARAQQAAAEAAAATDEPAEEDGQDGEDPR